MSNRAPNQSWFLRRELNQFPNGYVFTTEDDGIRVTYFETENESATFFLSRSDARLLAKRINACLDATAKR